MPRGSDKLGDYMLDCGNCDYVTTTQMALQEAADSKYLAFSALTSVAAAPQPFPVSRQSVFDVDEPWSRQNVQMLDAKADQQLRA